MAIGPMCPLMCWLLSCVLCCFAVLADGWQVILGEFPSTCTQCPRSAHTVQQLAQSTFKPMGTQMAPLRGSEPGAEYKTG